jgi:hypothetical protein
MLGQLFTRISMRSWLLATASLGIVVALAIAIAPKPTCKREVNTPPPALIEPQRTRVTWAPPPRPNPCDANDFVWHQRTVRQVIEAQLACGRQLAESMRTRYLALMMARELDTEREFAGQIDAELIWVAPRAAVTFLTRKEYDNAAAAVLVAKSLGVRNEIVTDVETALARTR